MYTPLETFSSTPIPAPGCDSHPAPIIIDALLQQSPSIEDIEEWQRLRRQLLTRNFNRTLGVQAMRLKLVEAVGSEGVNPHLIHHVDIARIIRSTDKSDELSSAFVYEYEGLTAKGNLFKLSIAEERFLRAHYAERTLGRVSVFRANNQ